MKHIKLFENFKPVHFDKIKELPLSGSFYSKNKFELETIANYLDEHRYTVQNPELLHANGMIWHTTKTTREYFLVEEYGDDGDDLDHIKFNKYFKLKYEFRGHNMKKFGV